MLRGFSFEPVNMTAFFDAAGSYSSTQLPVFILAMIVAAALIFAGARPIKR